MMAEDEAKKQAEKSPVEIQEDNEEEDDKLRNSEEWGDEEIIRERTARENDTHRQEQTEKLSDQLEEIQEKDKMIAEKKVDKVNKKEE